MPRPLLILSQSGYLIQIVVINLHTRWQTVQIQISWLLQKPTDLDLHCLQNRVYPGSAGQGLSIGTDRPERTMEMPHNTASAQGLHYLPLIKQFFRHIIKDSDGPIQILGQLW